jgi:hypothetical protein
MDAMNAIIESGSGRDLYYSSKEGNLVETIPVLYTTRYTNNINNPGVGQYSFTLPPMGGYASVILMLKYSASAINGQLGAQALERGWGYKAVKQASWRVSGSQQYFLSGQQLLARAVAGVRTQSQADAILSLGGQECKVAADFDTDQYAYIVLPFWQPASIDSLPLPLPSELLSQQIVLTVELNDPSAFWSAPAPGIAPNPPIFAPVALPSGFSAAYFQVSQRNMVDKSMAIPGEKLNNEGYIMPLSSFEQQELRAQLGAQSTEQEVAISGFRSGQCTKLRVWLTENPPTGPSPSAVDAANADANALYWVAPLGVTAIYGGLTYAQYQDGTSAIWNLIENTKPAAVNQSVLDCSSGVWTSVPKISSYVELPFGGIIHSDYEASLTTQSIRITNGTVNLRVLTPNPLKTYTLHVSPCYVACVAFQRGTADIIVN